MNFADDRLSNSSQSDELDDDALSDGGDDMTPEQHGECPNICLYCMLST